MEARDAGETSPDSGERPEEAGEPAEVDKPLDAEVTLPVAA
jgi:hypothetical protein